MDASNIKGLEQHTEHVRPEWVDYNGHMNVAYYTLVFDHASDLFLEQIGLNQEFRDASECSVFVVEAHTTYQKEVMEGNMLSVSTQILDFDAKRIHLFHRMISDGSDDTVATNELMLLYVSMKSRRTALMPEKISTRLQTVHTNQKALPRPVQAGRSIQIFRKNIALS
ncbi:MAG: thioesterase-like protein [Magnetovibrio sp.]|nr:thioesterase-like protein [Magnetovibrio sp.]|tara:strand:- start:1371 stop:1874 length:504 start_codon:yes stop_codon:yes gene_type:complete